MKDQPLYELDDLKDMQIGTKLTPYQLFCSFSPVPVDSPVIEVNKSKFYSLYIVNDPEFKSRPESEPHPVNHQFMLYIDPESKKAQYSYIGKVYIIT